MRIGLTGTVSVGKTTLAKALGELDQFKGYTIQTERSKYLNNLGIPLNTDSTLPGQFIFLAERASELLQENIVTDRTIWDVCSFTLSAKSIDDWAKQSFVTAAMYLKDYYDLVIYVSPRGVSVENNGLRTTDLAYRIKIDNAIQMALEEFPPKRLIKISGSTEDRIKVVLKEIFGETV